MQRNIVTLIAISWMLQFHKLVWRPDGSLNIAMAGASVVLPAVAVAVSWTVIGVKDLSALEGVGRVSAQAVNDMQLFVETFFAASCLLTLRSVVGVVGALMHGPETPARRPPAMSPLLKKLDKG